MLDFWSLSAEEILQGIKLIENPQLAHPNHPLRWFLSDINLQTLAIMWMASDQDFTLMKLRYSDTIQQLNQGYYASKRVHGHA